MRLFMGFSQVLADTQNAPLEVGVHGQILHLLSVPTTAHPREEQEAILSHGYTQRDWITVMAFNHNRARLLMKKRERGVMTIDISLNSNMQNIFSYFLEVSKLNCRWTNVVLSFAIIFEYVFENCMSL